MKYHLGSPRIGCRHNIVVSTIFLSNVQHLIFYQCIIVPRLHLLLLHWKQHFPKKEMKRDFWKTIPQQVHTPSKRACRGWSDHRHLGPNLMRLESSLKWPGYYNSWNTQVIRAEFAQKKWRPNPPTTKVYKKKSFHIFCFHWLGEIRVLISRSSEGSSLIFVTCLLWGQVTIPWLKWLTDALASEPTLQIWPRGFSPEPGRVRKQSPWTTSWSAWRTIGCICSAEQMQL